MKVDVEKPRFFGWTGQQCVRAQDFVQPTATGSRRPYDEERGKLSLIDCERLGKGLVGGVATDGLASGPGRIGGRSDTSTRRQSSFIPAVNQPQ